MVVHRNHFCSEKKAVWQCLAACSEERCGANPWKNQGMDEWIERWTMPDHVGHQGDFAGLLLSTGEA